MTYPYRHAEASGDYVELQVFEDGGGPLSLDNTSGNSARMCVTWVAS